jgi:hypothetical protein
MSYDGYISGIDVIKGKHVTCFAFVTNKRRSPAYIQVQTDEPRIQTALEMASVKGAKVEVEYTEVKGLKLVNRVRLLDR